MVELRFHGHSCWQIDHGEHRLLIDPFLGDNPKADIAPGDIDRLDAIVLTHGHFDHIADAEEISNKTGALIVSNFEIATFFEGKGCKAHPMHIGGGRQFPFGHVKFTIAHHGSTGPGGESLGNPMGVVLTLGDRRIYHAGDTGLFLDMQLIGEVSGPLDVALLPIGDNFTMGVEDAARASKMLGARLTVPMHYDTFDVIEVDAADFAARVEAQGGKARVMQPGESLQL
ncbi:MAG: metal-dependent hydrolase [bacterium]|nr:metal-dependent hydrolase [bacterium]